jgi:cellulose synthase/poly-beta-1,6-N-acetylglucosamine synthase-like glycosyltransferase
VSTHPKHTLWESYENSLKHALHLNTVRNHTKIHLSKSGAYVAPIIAALFACLICLAISLLLIRTRLLAHYNEQESLLSLYQQLSFLLVFYSIFFAVSVVALVIKNLVYQRLSHVGDLLLLMGLNVLVVPLSLLYSFQPTMLAINLCICLLLLIAGKTLFKHYTYAGINFYLASCLTLLVGLGWGAYFFVSMPASMLTKILVFCTAPFLLIIIPSKFLQLLELYDIVCRDYWRRPRHAFPEDWIAHEPFVSIHVPTYSEPPELVMETLDKLAAIDYTNYEVIVIDNNTKDPNLWLPVQAHCKKLGSKFRFMHVDNLSGAKGGALNYIHKYIDPRATIVGVIDADYQVEKTFLKSLLGHFADQKVGFVQTPHDYRDWRDNLFLTMCYWEYKIFFHTTMISLNERDAGITVGTMCLVRKEALEKAGGWSEWCVTEDSELAIRIHDVGYSSVYVDKTYGRGLIPDSFEGYKKQRYRWTAGPVQEFRHHYKHFIGLSKRESNFTFLQRIFHLNHGLANTLLGLNIPFMLISIAVVASMVLHDEVIPVPFELWLTATVTIAVAPLLTFLLYRVTVKATIREIIGQAIAAHALYHVIFHAALRTAITGSAAWSRTSKFKSTQSYVTAVLSTKEEITIGLCLLAFVAYAFSIFPHQGLSMMMLIGVIYVALGYFAAPLMAIIGVRSFKDKHPHNPSAMSNG